MNQTEQENQQTDNTDPTQRRGGRTETINQPNFRRAVRNPPKSSQKRIIFQYNPKSKTFETTDFRKDWVLERISKERLDTILLGAKTLKGTNVYSLTIIQLLSLTLPFIAFFLIKQFAFQKDRFVSFITLAWSLFFVGIANLLANSMKKYKRYHVLYGYLKEFDEELRPEGFALRPGLWGAWVELRHEGKDKAFIVPEGGYVNESRVMDSIDFQEMKRREKAREERRRDGMFTKDLLEQPLILPDVVVPEDLSGDAEIVAYDM